ncbi:uncharacterized protein N7515_004804 [Penicillium bovifimosum]|uniref:Uncharacterized protein n=1 Tax=Penicillium bovifimosum TaxID=126998 RepID=A0A9W9L3V0_9EURO|nr:uncharacterized protein N7515_004804 [Penicillium bovifimosum]KAJ5135526.1 hypothetical protein N7515_004804 [Penicillium bovifimosum]
MSEHERQPEGRSPAQPDILSQEDMEEIDADLSSGFQGRSSDPQVTRYRAIGAQLQKWIDDPNAEGCTVAEATLTMQDLIDNGDPDNDWEVVENTFVNSVADLPEAARIMMGLPTSDDGAHFRHMRIKRKDLDCYEMTTGEAFIACHLIFRYSGPHCNEVTNALYEQDFRIESLRNVAFIQVVNPETAPLVTGVLYPRRGMRFAYGVADQEPQVWLHGTPEYQEILGTEIGKTVAYLVLSCFQRGTRPISRIITCSDSGDSLCMVFEIGYTD